MIENNNLNITAQSKLLGEVLIIEKLNASSSDGQLEKVGEHYGRELLY